jgi:putative flippase GtrA
MDFIKFFKFGIVGASGLCIDFCITWIFKEKVGANKYLSNSLGFLVAVTNNYILNKYFTFQNTNSQFITQLISFLVIALIGLGLNLFILYWLQTYSKINFYLCKIAATAIVFIWNFTANYFITFN